MSGSAEDIDHNDDHDKARSQPDASPGVLGVHVGFGVHSSWDISPTLVADASSTIKESGSLDVVDSSHIHNEKDEEDSKNGEDAEAELVEIGVLLLSSLIFQRNKVEADAHSDNTTDDGDVEDDSDVTVGLHHLGVHSSSMWSNSEVLASSGAASFDMESTEEHSFLSRSFVSIEEDSSHGGSTEYVVILDKLTKRILVSFMRVDGINTESLGVAWGLNFRDDSHPWSLTISSSWVLSWISAWSTEHFDSEVDEIRSLVDGSPSTILGISGSRSGSGSWSSVRESVVSSISVTSFSTISWSSTGLKEEGRVWATVLSNSWVGSGTFEALTFGASNVVSSTGNIFVVSQGEGVLSHSGGTEVDASPVHSRKSRSSFDGINSTVSHRGWGSTGLVDSSLSVSSDTSWPVVEVQVLSVRSASGSGGGGSQVNDTSLGSVSIEICISWSHDTVHFSHLFTLFRTIFNNCPDRNDEEKAAGSESYSEKLL